MLRLRKQAVGINSCQTSHYYQNNSISWALRNTEKLKTSDFFCLLRKIGMKILWERGHLALEIFAFLGMETWTSMIRCGVYSVNPGQVCEGCRWRCHALPAEMITLSLFCWILTLLCALSTHVRAVNGMTFGPFHTCLNTVCAHFLSLHHK